MTHTELVFPLVSGLVAVLTSVLAITAGVLLGTGQVLWGLGVGLAAVGTQFGLAVYAAWHTQAKIDEFLKGFPKP